MLIFCDAYAIVGLSFISSFMAKELKNKLEYFLEQIIESLLNLVPNGVKIMSTSGKVALKYVVYVSRHC